jgi:hypothetical protein
MHAFSLNGWITFADETEVRVRSSLDSTSELVVRLKPTGLSFDYMDSREVMGREAQEFESCLVIAFGHIPEEGDLDTIAFAARR